jgi:hypothetical protein
MASYGDVLKRAANGYGKPLPTAKLPRPVAPAGPRTGIFKKAAGNSVSGKAPLFSGGSRGSR